MTYTDIKLQLKSFQAQDYAIPPLNSRREVLEAALNEILASIAATPDEAIAIPTPEETTPAVEEITEEITLPEIKEMAARYEATGRCAFVHPKLKKVSLNGGKLLNFSEAKERMNQLLLKEIVEPEVVEEAIAPIAPITEPTEEIAQPLTEYTITTQEFVDRECGSIEISYVSEEILVRKKTCKCCGEGYLIRGFSHSILDKGICKVCMGGNKEITADAIEPTEEIQETAPVVKLPGLSPLVKEMDFAPARSVWDMFQLRLTPDLIFVRDVVLYAIALCKFLAIKATPYVKKGLTIALKIAVWTAVLMEVWIYPKLQLVGYTVAIWAVLLAIKVRDRIVEMTAASAIV